MANTPAEVIKNFIKTYKESFNEYRTLADLAAEAARGVLEKRKIPALVTARAKDPARLQTKLENRHGEKKSLTAADIEKDIVDLIGIRVALYIPSLVDNAISALASEVPSALQTQKQGSAPSTPFMMKSKSLGTKIHDSKDSYKAVHLRVNVHPHSDLSNQAVAANVNFKVEQSIMEVQIQTVVMHAWAEVNHDLIYKTLNGKPSDQEKKVLNELNQHMVKAEGIINKVFELTETRQRFEKANQKPTIILTCPAGEEDWTHAAEEDF